MKRYDDEKEIFNIVRRFEDCTIGRDEWRHAEHLTVALCYLDRFDFDTATAKMRDGIFDLLRKGFEVDLVKEMPYHETLTVFWMRTVDDFNRAADGLSMLDKANGLVAKFDKDYPLRFYSREVLFSDAARSAFIEPEHSDLNGNRFL